MGLQIPSDVNVPPQYSVAYKKKNESISISTPSLDDAKTLFEWAAQKVGLIPTPP